MDNFDLKKYISDNPLLKEEILTEVSDADIVKAVAQVVNMEPKDVVAKVKAD